MSGTKTNNKLMFIVYAYAIGTILVVLGHSTPTGTSDMPAIIERIRVFVYCFHMPLFFFIAGYLLKYTINRRQKPYRQFIKEKSIKFLTPYVVLSLIGLIPKVLLSAFVDDEVGFDFYHLVEFFFAPRLNVWGHFWFLPTLLIIYAVSYIILACNKKKILYALVIAVALGLALFQIDTLWFAIKDICQQLIYFCVGILFADIITKWRNKVFKLPVAMITMAIAIGLYVVMIRIKAASLINQLLIGVIKIKVIDFWWSSVIVNLLNVFIALLMIYTVLYFSVFLEHKGNKLLEYFDGKTFSIYIMSWPCQAAAEVVFNRMLHMHWYVTMPAMFLAGLLVPLLVLHIYKKLKHHPRFINLVIGTN